MTHDKIDLQSADQHRFEAFQAWPAGLPHQTAAKGGVVILHAIYGLTPHIADVCQRWAGAGYRAIAPALFDRRAKGLVHPYSAAGAAAGRDCYASLSEGEILADIAACAEAIGTAGPRIVSGFCTGGTWAWVAAAKCDFDLQVNFYGSHVANRLDLAPRCATVMHYGDSDHIVPLTDIDAIKAAHPALLVHVYPGAGHAFFNPDQPTHDARAAEDAWRNTLAFLDRARA